VHGRAGLIAGLLALVVALFVAVALPTTESAPDPATASPLALTLRSTAWIRLVAILWCLCGLLLATLAALTGRVPALAGATLIGLAAGTVALASTELLIAAAAAVVAGVVGLLVTAPAPDAGMAAARGGDGGLDIASEGPTRPQPIRIRRAPGPAAGPAAVTAVAARELRGEQIQARQLVGQLQWGPELFGYQLNHPDKDKSYDERDSASQMLKCRVIDPAFTWGPFLKPETSWARTVIYEMHVKGFTKRHPLVPEQDRGTFAGLAHHAIPAYLRSLGVTTVELCVTPTEICSRSPA